MISTLPLVAAGIGISIVPASLQHMNIRGVVYRRLDGQHATQGPAQPRIASRRHFSGGSTIREPGQAKSEKLSWDMTISLEVLHISWPARLAQQCAEATSAPGPKRTSEYVRCDVCYWGKSGHAARAHNVA